MISLATELALVERTLANVMRGVVTKRTARHFLAERAHMALLKTACACYVAVTVLVRVSVALVVRAKSRLLFEAVFGNVSHSVADSAPL